MISSALPWNVPWDAHIRTIKQFSNCWNAAISLLESETAWVTNGEIWSLSRFTSRNCRVKIYRIRKHKQEICDKISKNSSSFLNSWSFLPFWLQFDHEFFSTVKSDLFLWKAYVMNDVSTFFSFLSVRSYTLAMHVYKIFSVSFLLHIHSIFSIISREQGRLKNRSWEACSHLHSMLSRMSGRGALRGEKRGV